MDQVTPQVGLNKIMDEQMMLNVQQKKEILDKNMYKKRKGTSGIQGQLYETKLICLIYFRLKHDDNITQFSLATNRDDVGAFDDICFKAKVKGFNKPVTVFIQAKHRENEKLLTFNSKTELAKYFESYLDIRRAFDLSSKDAIFGGNFDETECFFVMYTTAKDDPNNKIYEGSLADFLNNLIGTGGSCTQPSYNDIDLDLLCKIAMKEQITTLAKQVAKFICDESDSEMSVNNDLMLRYHVILALNVLQVSEIQPEGHRIASFRKDFFSINDEFLVQFKTILCLEIVKKRKSEDNNLQSLLLQFLSEPSEITTLSKLLGIILTYKKNKLKFINKSVTDDLKRQLDKANVPESTVYEAAELAAKEYLLSLKLKVSVFFGNNDLAIRGKLEKIEKRLVHLTKELIEIFERSKSNNIITIDESLGDGFLRLNGGIASAVGNILVYDETTKLLKFTDNVGSLDSVAKIWYEMLNSKIKNLHGYRLDVKVKKFPKLSFERGEYDVYLVRDFYDKLLFYTNQADQSGVQEILKEEMEDHPCKDANNLRVRSNDIFLNYHDEIQKLWMTPKKGSYLTKQSKIYENAVKMAMNEPLTTVLNTLHKIRDKGYTFNENAVKQLELRGKVIGTVIVTGSCVLTVAKLEQYLGKKDHVVLDLEDVLKLPLKGHNTLCKELRNTINEKILILLCNFFQDTVNSSKKLENIVKSVHGKQIIIVTNKISVDIITEYFSQLILNVDRTVLTDMNFESQKKLLASSKLKFQGVSISLKTLVDDETAQLIDEDVINKIIDNETLVIGKSVIYYDYNDVKPFYIDRRLSRKTEQGHDSHVLKTLNDLESDVVLICGCPGGGKSTLLTHLSLKTKDLDPKVWIVRINFLEHYKIFKKWQDSKIVINTLESLKFLCHAAFSEEFNDSSSEGLIELEESSDGTVSLTKCSGGDSIVFQTKIFLHFYNKGKLIFIFDGFDEVVPTYENEAYSLLKAITDSTRQCKIWIASRFCNHWESETILGNKLGPPYFLEPFSVDERDTYCYEIWKSELQFKDLNSEQLEIVYSFVKFALKARPLPQIESHVDNILFKLFYLKFLTFLKIEAVANNLDFPHDELDNLVLKLEGDLSCFPAELLLPQPYQLKRLTKGFPRTILELII